MKAQITDFHGADGAFGGPLAAEGREILDALATTPLYLKASDQAGKSGSLIFSPVATNKAIGDALTPRGWTKWDVPNNLAMFGIDVDYAKHGVVVECQFSNYPFLMNNVVRSDLFHRRAIMIGAQGCAALVVITKARMFPASNSTLYYEQAVAQLREAEREGMFRVPVRLIGLFEDIGVSVPAKIIGYASKRYSRTATGTKDIRCRLVPNREDGGRCHIEVEEQD